MLAVVTVNTDQDIVDPIDQLTSLREAVVMANNLPGHDEITFELGHGRPATIQLEQRELELTDAVTITGPGPTLLTIDAQQQSRIFNVTASRGDFAINGLTLTNGRVSETDGDPSGGAIRSTTRGMLAIGKVTISNSSAVSNGGAISARDVTITSSTISGNSAGDFVITRGEAGGGISAENVNITSSTISANRGGGIFAGSVTVSSSTIVRNSIASVGIPFAGIRALFGGGIDASGDISVANSIVAGNELNYFIAWSESFSDSHARTFASDLTSWDGSRLGSVTVRHSLIGHNRGAPLVEAPLGNPDSNGNLIGGPDSGVIDPRIGALSDNGGLTLTHPLLPDSPAIDAGDPSLADMSQFDQRGETYSRVADGRTDMGAYERQNLTAAMANIASPTVQPVDAVTIDFSRPVSGFDVTDFRLSRNTDGNLLTGDEVLSTTDNQSFVLSGLTNLANAPGFYTLTLIGSHSGIQAADNTPLDSSASIRWTMGRAVLGLAVDTLVDEVDGRIDDGDISLRDALAFAAPGETITFDPSLDGGTLVLSLGELRINRSVTVDAMELAAGLVIDASGNDPTPDENDGQGSRVFVIDDGDWLTDSPATLRGLVLTGGDVDAAGGAILTQETLSLEATSIFGNSSVARDSQWNHSDLEQALASDKASEKYRRALDELRGRAATSTRRGRGAISGSGNVTVSSSTISENGGSGIVTSGSVTVRSSTVSKNAGTGVMAGENVVVDASTISENDWVGIGGSLVTIDSSTVSENGATGVGAADSVTVNSSTISGNNNLEVRFSAGISARAPIIVNSSTITENIGGIYIGGWNNSLKIADSIVAGNRGRSGSVGAEPSGDLGLLFPSDAQWHIRHSLIGDNRSTELIGDNRNTELPEAPMGSPDADGNLIGGPTNGVIDPRLAPLRDNGGPTLTHALLPDSPAINMGDPSAVIGADGIPTFDQRGEPYSRLIDGRTDMGAFERGVAGDINGDDKVDFADFLMLANHFGTGQGWAEGNFDGSEDGTQFADFLALSANFGFDGSGNDLGQAERVDRLYSQFA